MHEKPTNIAQEQVGRTHITSNTIMRWGVRDPPTQPMSRSADLTHTTTIRDNAKETHRHDPGADRQTSHTSQQNEIMRERPTDTAQEKVSKTSHTPQQKRWCMSPLTQQQEQIGGPHTHHNHNHINTDNDQQIQSDTDQLATLKTLPEDSKHQYHHRDDYINVAADCRKVHSRVFFCFCLFVCCCCCCCCCFFFRIWETFVYRIIVIVVWRLYCIYTILTMTLALHWM